MTAVAVRQTAHRAKQARGVASAAFPRPTMNWPGGRGA